MTIFKPQHRYMFLGFCLALALSFGAIKVFDVEDAEAARGGVNVEVGADTGAANIAASRAAADDTSRTLVAARTARRAVQIFNFDGIDTLYVGTGTVSKANGYPVKPGTSIRIVTYGAVNGVAFGAGGGSSAVAACLEEYDD